MTETTDEFDVAIVGMAGRFPGACTLDEFWRNLAGGVESIPRLSDEEILASGVPAVYLGMANYVKAAPVLDEPGHFAASYFGFTPAEARVLDPQHRLLLELAHEAFENAGCDPARHPGRIGVFAGSALNTYFTNVGLNERLADDYIPTLISNDKDFLATRISYKLNLKGPSIAVQTACSTSLVAAHLARQSLLSGETDVAVVGAISVRVPHRAGYVADSGGVVSPDGHVRAFDAKANGTVFGSGGGVLVLKRLTDAIAAGDTVRAVIKGSAVNNDGQAKAGYSAPSVNGQMDVVTEALANAGVAAESIGYVEAHGSGTPVGDPIELMALTKAFRTETQRSGFCAIGSVKTNVGHLDVAAGLAGIMKTVLALEHGQIPASLHFTEGNPEIDFPNTPFFVNTQLRPWPISGTKRAAVMSTGMGGTNASLVLEQAPVPTASSEARPPHLLVLSAKTETALDAATRELGEFLVAHDGLNMGDVAYTLQTGRAAHRYRRVLTCTGQADAATALREAGSKRLRSGQTQGAKRPVVFLFPGIGDHYVGMGFDLYESQPVFRETVDQCASLFHTHIGVDIRTILYPASRSWQQQKASGKGIDLKAMLGNRGDAPADPDATALNQTQYAQPALFTIEYAMAKLWESLGVVPDAMVCHSMGEYVAACLSGVLSLEDAARLIATRATLVNALPHGAMLAVMLPEQDLLPLLGAQLSISLINGPKLCVVAGPPDDVAALEKTLTAQGIISRHVQNAHAFHSRMLDPIVEPFQAEVRKARLGEPRIPYTSNVTGAWITAQEAKDPAYWGKHANHTARFNDALQALWQLQNPILVEVGPGRTLGVLAAQHPGKAQAGDSTVVASLRPRYEHESDTAVLLQGVGQLWVAGVDPRWDSLYPGERRGHVPLPTYPFERQEYWIARDATKRSAGKDSAAVRTDTSETSVDDWFHVPVWQKTSIRAERPESSQEQPFWLIVGDRYGGGARANAAVQDRGHTAAWVRFGEKFGARGDGAFELDPRSADDYRRLFRELKPAFRGPVNILHFGSLIHDSASDAWLSAPTAQHFGLYSLLYIAQAVGDLGIDVPIRIGVVSNRMHEVTGDEVLAPEMAPVLGPCGVIPKEFPNIACFNVDLPGGDAADALSGETLAKVMAEFSDVPESGVVAYRGRHRWQRTYTQVRLPALSSSTGDGDAATSQLRPGGVYLITGGTGGIGLVIARYLAAAYRPKILLTKKHAFPPKAAWKKMVTSTDVAESVRQTLAALLELEDLGAEVEVVVAEVSDRAQMQQVISSAIARYGAIHGVIHAAGIVRAGLIQAKSRETVEAVLAPKVDGTAILFDLLRDVHPDFLVLFSSITSVLAPYAESDYSGANAFLDAFGCFANSRGGFRTITINWPGWREVGQLVNLKTQPGVERWKEVAMSRAIASRDGLEAFQRILRSGHDRVIVSPESLLQLLEHEKLPFDPAEYLVHPSGGRDALSAKRDETGIVGPTGEIEAVTDVEAAVREVWMTVFGFERVGIHETFAELGGHSLIAMQIVAKVKALFEVELTLRDFFAAPTIAGLSADVERRVLQEIENMSDEEAQQLVRTMDANGVVGPPDASVDR